MINHVRTILFNRTRAGAGLDQPGEEYIQTGFTPRILTPTMESVSRVLLGGDTSRSALNYRMHQIMQVMHATPLEVDITAKDSRITYLPFKDDLFTGPYDLQYNSATWSYGFVAPGDSRIQATDKYLRFFTNNNPAMPAEPAHKRWLVHRVPTSGVDFRVTQLHAPFTSVDVPSVTNDTSLPLVGTNMTFKIQNVSGNAYFEIVAKSRPVFDLADTFRLVLQIMGESGLREIFSSMPSEPYATWYDIFNNSQQATVFRFTALLLAMAERLETFPKVRN